MIRLKPFPMLHEQHTRSYRIWASAECTSSDLRLRFRIEGADSKEFKKVNLPAEVSKTPSRKAELWKDTCFECFIPVQDSEAYLELNLAPDGCWNAYAFKKYREGMTEFQIKPESIPRQAISTSSDRDVLNEWVIPLTGLRQGMMSVKQNELRFDSVGLTAVLNTTVGTTYWALAHDGVKPDFHIRSSFNFKIK